MARTEKEYQKGVTDLRDFFGWRWYHTWNSRRSPAGFPDIVAVHPEGGAIFIELKAERGRLTAPQREWLDELNAAGAKAYLWRDGETEWDEVFGVLDVEKRAIRL